MTTPQQEARARAIHLQECVCTPAVPGLCYKHRQIAAALAHACAEGAREERERREFRTRDHPMANGRRPERGEDGWIFSFPLEDGTTLKVQAGKVGREALIGMLNEEATDDALDAALRARDAT